MLESKKKSDRKVRRTSLSGRLLRQYILSIICYFAGLIAITILASLFCNTFIWYGNEPIYKLLQFIKEYILIFIVVFALIGWIIITSIFINKPLRYLDEAVAASERLANLSGEPIILPPAMRDTENEMNLVREKALNDARAARDAEQRKNDLIVYLAHDLKTPLTSVIGYLTLLRDEPQISQELQAKYTGIALNKAQRLEDLINEFFDITRFSLTRLTLNQENVNLTMMLEQMTYEFICVLNEKNLKWKLHFEPDIRVICDPDKLERVFDNLFRNAVNYSYRESEIEVSLMHRGGRAVIYVKNRGRTIPPEKLNKIFEQYFRLDSSRASSTGGAGLGLAIAKQIVDMHGGSIDVESADESILFTVELPAETQSV